jgi:phage portal protein BeeE
VTTQEALSPRDLDVIKSRNAAAHEIALALGVPPPECEALKS